MPHDRDAEPVKYATTAEGTDDMRHGLLAGLVRPGKRRLPVFAFITYAHVLMLKGLERWSWNNLLHDTRDPKDPAHTDGIKETLMNAGVFDALDVFDVQHFAIRHDVDTPALSVHVRHG